MRRALRASSTAVLSLLLAGSAAFSAEPPRSGKRARPPESRSTSDAATPAARPVERGTAAEAFTIGRLLALEGEFRQAIEHLRVAVQRDPQDAYLRLELAN